MSKQTAVEWFHEETWKIKMLLEKQQISIGEYAVAYNDLFNQAKAMEREQIVEAYYDGTDLDSIFATSSQYYEQTYGKEARHEG